MTGKRFASCIMCFALTAALFSVSRGWASENEMNLTEESAEQSPLEEKCDSAVSALCKSVNVSVQELAVQNGETGEDTDLVQNAEPEETAPAQAVEPEEEMTSAQIEDFPIIYQMPELPTGCEITALTMAVNYYGYPADKTVMASEYLPTASANRYYGADRRAAQGWYTENRDYVDWSTNDHGAVLIGYTDTTVPIADPISGRMEYSREQFEKVFSSRGNRCVVLE